MNAAVSRPSRVLGVLRGALSQPDLRRVELAYIGFNIAEYGSWVAIMVFAYRVGGATAAGVLGAAQLVPAALFAPLASYFGDRYPRNRVLVASYATQAVAMALTGIAMAAGAPVALVYVLAAIAATSVTLTRPVQGALLPALARTPAELIAANVAASWMEGLSIFAGPLFTGVLLALSTPGVVFLTMAAVLVGSTLLTLGLPAQGVEPTAETGVTEGVLAGTMWRGLRSILGEPRPRLVVSLMINFLLVGAVDVLLVVLAIGLMGLGASGVGYLTAAFGFGGLVGAVAATFLTTGRRFSPVLLGAAGAWGFGLALAGLAPGRVAALFLIAVAGLGKPLIDVIGRILLQRVVSDAVLSRALGALEGLSMAAQAAGMLLVPLLVGLLDARWTFVVFGAILPVLMLVLWRSLMHVDAAHIAAEERIALLHSLPIFAPLSVPVLLHLARRLASFTVPAGAVILREGAHGDRFYIVCAGEVTVARQDHRLATFGPGGFFGEIALLRDVPRTASVSADFDTSLYALARADFLQAVNSHSQSMAIARSVSDERLEEQMQTIGRQG